MKTFATTLIALLIGVSAFAQQDFPRNEVSVNLVTTTLLQYPIISYERILAPDFSIGASLGFNLGDEYFLDFNLTPFVRWYFGGNRETMNRAGTGFFIEGSTALYSSNRGRDNFMGEGSFQSAIDVGIGAGIGWKYLTRSNWTGEVLVGGGRSLSGATIGYLRGGVSIGRRF